MLSRFKTEYTSFFKIFKSSYRTDVKTIRNASKKIGAKFNDDEIITLLQLLREITSEKRWFSENTQLLNDCFGNFYFGDKTDWDMIDTGLSYIEKVCSLFPQGIVPQGIIEIICDKSSHAAEYIELDKAVSFLSETALMNVKDGIAAILSGFSDCSVKDILPRMMKLSASSKELLDLIQTIENHLTKEITKDRFLEIVDAANNVANFKKKILEANEYYERLFTSRFKGIDTNWDDIISDLEAVSAFFALPSVSIISSEFISLTCDNNDYRNKILTSKKNLENQIAESDNRFKAFCNLFSADTELADMSVSDVSNKVSACLNNIILLDNWLACIETKAVCDTLGLSDFTAKMEQSDNTIEDVVSVFKRGFYTAWVQSVIGNKKSVEQFRRHVHDDKIGHFVSLDDKQLLIARERIRQNVINNIPDANRIMTANDELSVLQREIGKKRRVMPLRKLFKSIPNLLLKLKPCLMMSPLSVAYFLEAESYEFDTVIFDEASQIFPEDAIGAIFRGKQVIIAGDSKQLPPSAFFKTATSNNEDDYDAEYEDELGNEIFDSILEETTGVLPNRSLLWHYRSKHENLIAFSNQFIYGNDLITFPSSVEISRDTGVEFVFVEDGIYEGKGRNTGEARRCVELIKEHIDKHPNRSLGVIAFSESQQKTILLEIQKFREQNPEYENFFVEDREDEFFVKNLENVQGDERDTILFSVSYAKTKEQRDNNRSMALRFGPLGQKGGERRLNVAITRAKLNVKLVSSILPSDIDLSRTESEGVRMLRSYIEFAMTGSETLHTVHTSDENDVFMDIVAEYILSNGYKIKKYVGCSGYKIDIAIVHPEKENCFVVGIECDGFSYAEAKTVRDRDHLRKSVLESMGWNIYRVWSPEWIVRPEVEQQRLITFIENAINNYDAEIKPKEKASVELHANTHDFAESIHDDIHSTTQINMVENGNGIQYGFMYYEEAIWSNTPNILGHHGADITAEEIKYIVEIEQPINIELLYQRMAGAFGRQKATKPVKDSVESVIKSRLKGLINKDNDGFITMANFKNLKVRVPLPGSQARQVNYISPDEIGLAMTTIASQAIGISAEHLVDATARALGYARKGERVISCLNKALEKLVTDGSATIIDGKVNVAGGTSHG